MEKVEHRELISKAQDIDRILNLSKFITIVLGDVKLVNFCFSPDRRCVAAVGFQYVGGCGVKDVSYLLSSCFYNSEYEDLEGEWRKIKPHPWTDFTRFMLACLPTYPKIHGHSLSLIESVLKII